VSPIPGRSPDSRPKTPGLPCATLSMLTYYRTSESRSLHFPFWAVCSLSGAQPEIWSVGWNPPVHRIAFRLFVAFPFKHVLRRQPRRRARGPRAPLARSTRAHTAQGGSEDVEGLRGAFQRQARIRRGALLPLPVACTCSRGLASVRLLLRRPSGKCELPFAIATHAVGRGPNTSTSNEDQGNGI
jgi:hypothetical protein